MSPSMAGWIEVGRRKVRSTSFGSQYGATARV
jgi:hypothetical protein